MFNSSSDTIAASGFEYPSISIAACEEFYRKHIFVSEEQLQYISGVGAVDTYFSPSGTRKHRIGASSVFTWVHMKDTTDPVRYIKEILLDNSNALSNIQAVKDGKLWEQTAIDTFFDWFQEQFLSNSHNKIMVNKIILKPSSICLQPAVPFLVAQIDALVEIRLNWVCFFSSNHSLLFWLAYSPLRQP